MTAHLSREKLMAGPRFIEYLSSKEGVEWVTMAVSNSNRKIDVRRLTRSTIGDLR